MNPVMESKYLEVKKILEGRSVSGKIDFINTYDFEDNLDSYYISYILNHDYVNSNSNLSAFIIDIAYYKNISNNDLSKFMIHLLSQKVNYIVKLSILDYLNHVMYKPSREELADLKDNNKNYSYLVKLEIIFLSIRFYDSEFFSFDDLLNIIRNKKSHWVYIRFFKGLERIGWEKFYDKSENIMNALDVHRIKLKSVSPYFSEFKKAIKAGL